jgi:hypothetical protein
VVTEVQPFVTATINGQRDSTTGGFGRENPDPSGGVNVRVGLPQLSLDATINPDFSQVESDAGLVTVNERFALFIPEKRPFFLEGIELFSTPNQLVYTRRIVDPVVGGKLTGKFGPLGVAYLAALDETPGRDALFNVARFRTDFGGNSVAGLTVTDRRVGNEFNTVVAGDSRIVFGTLYYFEGQLGGSWTRRAGGTRAAPLWKAELDRTGRSWGFNYQVNGIGDAFESDAGFVPRPGIVSAHAFNRFTLYGGRGALLENFTTYVIPTRIWRYDDFARHGAIEGVDEISWSVQLRGGWRVTADVSRSSFVLDDAPYAGLRLRNEDGTFVPYVPPRKLSGLYAESLSVATPVYGWVNADVTVSHGEVVLFDEGAPGREVRVRGAVTFRPLPSVRAEGSAVISRLRRERDDSEFARTVIPRLKLEYQPTRALFFRVVGEYRSERRAALEDARTGAPLFDGDVLAAARERGALRMDWLASYEPTPGTVAFFGYGARLASPDASRLSTLERTDDGFFLKLAYQFRR